MAKKSTIDIPVKFGSVSNSGKKTARIGITIEKNMIDVERAEEMFCDSRLAVNLVCDPNDKGDKAQGKLDDISEIKITGIADVKGYRSNVDHFTIGLTFALAELNLDNLRQLNGIAGKGGSLKAERTGSASEASETKKAA